jgi:hypothetical protein
MNPQPDCRTQFVPTGLLPSQLPAVDEATIQQWRLYLAAGRALPFAIDEAVTEVILLTGIDILISSSLIFQFSDSGDSTRLYRSAPAKQRHQSRHSALLYHIGQVCHAVFHSQTQHAFF